MKNDEAIRLGGGSEPGEIVQIYGLDIALPKSLYQQVFCLRAIHLTPNPASVTDTARCGLHPHLARKAGITGCDVRRT